MRNVIPASVGFRLVPGNYFPMKGADRHGSALEAECGHSLTIWLKVDGDRINHASFITDGCDTFILCGSMVAHLSQGRTLQEALDLGLEEVLAALGDDQDAARHSADLALRAAVNAG